jgi:methionyl aminopeptidase
MSIESQDDYEGMTRAGQVVAQVLRAMETAVEVGIATIELDEIGAAILKSHGARSAPQLVYNCPSATLISVNDAIVHGLPNRRKLCAGDLVKLDVTAEVGGYMADAAVTVALPGATDAATRLRDCAATAFENACSTATAGRRVSAIGASVEKTVRSQGFAVIRALSGHGIGRTIHEPPTVLNYYDPFQRDLLTEGLVLTIEPLIAEAPTEMVEDRDGWTLRTRNGCLAAHHEHTVIITRSAPIVVTRH